jgi:hypothetical protein
MKLRHDLVFIFWDDAGPLDLGWIDEAEIKRTEPMLVGTPGYIVRKTKDHLIVAMHAGEQYHCHTQFQIPRKMVKSVHVIARRGTEFPLPTSEPNEHPSAGH